MASVLRMYQKLPCGTLCMQPTGCTCQRSHRALEQRNRFDLVCAVLKFHCCTGQVSVTVDLITGNNPFCQFYHLLHLLLQEGLTHNVNVLLQILQQMRACGPHCLPKYLVCVRWWALRGLQAQPSACRAHENLRGVGYGSSTCKQVFFF